MRKIRVIFTVNETDTDLYGWLDHIPAQYRNLMVRMALLDVIHNGAVNPEKYFPTKAPTNLQEKSRSEVRVAKQPEGRAAPNKKAAIPIAAKGDDLVAFTLANLPEGVTPELRDLAEQFPRSAPYSLEDLHTLKDLVTCSEKGD